MKTIIVAGPPSAGKTAVITHAGRLLLQRQTRVAAVKFDTRSNADPQHYTERLGIPAIGGLSGYLCPDHYFIANMEEAVAWGRSRQADTLFIETAGLCLRCAPHVEGIAAVTVIDSLGGLEAPVKMGPMLSLADVVVLTKGDLVSQPEREVLLYGVRRENPDAEVLAINGLTGTGGAALLKALQTGEDSGDIGARRLRHDMPAAICSYCTGEKRIGRAFQSGNVEKLVVTEEQS